MVPGLLTQVEKVGGGQLDAAVFSGVVHVLALVIVRNEVAEPQAVAELCLHRPAAVADAAVQARVELAELNAGRGRIERIGVRVFISKIDVNGTRLGYAEAV